MKNTIIQTLSLATFALSLSAFTGCVIVIDPNDPFGGHGEPEPQCAAIAIMCETGTEPTFAGIDDNGCPIESCEPVTCLSDSDCNDPNLMCLPAADCAPVDVGDEAGLVSDGCDHTCQPAVKEIDLCAEADCNEDETCVVELHCSPVTGECDERAACISNPEPITETTDDENADDPQDPEDVRYCMGDWDCAEGERCVPFTEESLDEDLSCGAYIEGICAPTIF